MYGDPANRGVGESADENSRPVRWYGSDHTAVVGLLSPNTPEVAQLLVELRAPVSQRGSGDSVIVGATADTHSQAETPAGHDIQRLMARDCRT
jgi:hypothetical protein